METDLDILKETLSSEPFDEVEMAAEEAEETIPSPAPEEEVEETKR